MIIKRTFTVELEAPDCKAEFVFKKPKTNKILEQNENKDDTKKYFLSLMEDLVSVKGLYDEDKSEIKVEEIKSLNLDYDIMLAIITGYNLAAFPKRAEDPEKKIS